MMIEMDPSSHRVNIRNNISFDKSQWECLDIVKDENILIVKTSNEDTAQDLLLIDTGDPKGLIVKKELLQQVKEDNTNTTLSAMYYPSMGLVVEKEKWVNEVHFGDLTFREVPVKMGMESYQALMEIGIDGILGMWGLSCYQWIIDGPEGKIYMKPNDLTRTPEMYEYNRLGAVFVPEDIQTGDALIAHVIEGGPGWRAGIRDGDELLKIGQIDATQWRTDPDVMPLGQFWSKPAGTVIDLVLLRGDKKINISITLEEIF
jgi:hypothetical protein